MGDSCKIIPKEKMEVTLRLFEEEIDEAESLAFLLDLSYEQLFVKLIKEELTRRGI